MGPLGRRQPCFSWSAFSFATRALVRVLLNKYVHLPSMKPPTLVYISLSSVCMYRRLGGAQVGCSAVRGSVALAAVPRGEGFLWCLG